MKDKINIQVVRHDDMDAFGAYAQSSIEDEKGGLVLLNIDSIVVACVEDDIDLKEMMLEVLMHEVGHAIEETLKLEFDEDRIERIIESYKEKYGGSREQ